MKTKSVRPVRHTMAAKLKKIRALRLVTMAAAAVLVVFGAVMNTATGSFSALGVRDISLICPLGYLETALAGKTIMPRLLISFFVIAALTVLLGRVFCGWICPVPLVRKALIHEEKEEREDGEKREDHGVGGGHMARIVGKQEITKDYGLQEGAAVDKHTASGLSILGITLASSAIFGFPVFCLICPIGLIFATLFALIRLFHFNEPSLDLLIFPAVIIIELVFLRKWCVKWCPVGALLSLFSRFNRRLVPTVNRSRCLEESHNVHCGMCRKACNLDIDLKKGMGNGAISECTKCQECATVCPAQAIHFPWEPKGLDQANCEPGEKQGKAGRETNSRGM